jgi:hypothetical protein
MKLTLRAEDYSVKCVWIVDIAIHTFYKFLIGAGGQLDVTADVKQGTAWALQSRELQ